MTEAEPDPIAHSKVELPVMTVIKSFGVLLSLIKR